MHLFWAKKGAEKVPSCDLSPFHVIKLVSNTILVTKNINHNASQFQGLKVAKIKSYFTREALKKIQKKSKPKNFKNDV